MLRYSMSNRVSTYLLYKKINFISVGHSFIRVLSGFTLFVLFNHFNHESPIILNAKRVENGYLRVVIVATLRWAL